MCGVKIRRFNRWMTIQREQLVIYQSRNIAAMRQLSIG
jgi:hypothetical protein